MSKEDFDRWEEERRERRERFEQRRAERRRERELRTEGGPADERGERKEHVLHTRVSHSLDSAIRRAADELRVPVSNLVRNVLEDVFDVVEKVTDNVGDLVEDVLDEVDGTRRRIVRERSQHARRREAREREEPVDGAESGSATPAADVERAEYPDVVGWQPLLLNASQRCADCGRDLLKGDKAFAGLTAAGLSGSYLCADCATARS